MDLVMQNLIQQMVSVALVAVLAVLLLAARYAIAYLRAKTANIYLQRAEAAMERAVLWAEQVLVPLAREKAADGKLTKEDAVAIKNEALAKWREGVGATGLLKVLLGIFGGEEKLGGWADRLLESKVAILPSNLPGARSAAALASPGLPADPQ